ncbi:hypothetical protein EON65_45255 [archaeon]|nr:MAG: hypothetical protein EON65_45255 [archaeon]
MLKITFVLVLLREFFFPSNSLSVLAASSQPVSELWQNMWRAKPKNDYSNLEDTDIIPESDLRPLNRTIWVITTACLPWMTGTSINPLLRAAYLAKDRPPGKVHLMVPWLNREEQDIAYPPGMRFNTPEEQKAYVYKWLVKDANMEAAANKLNISFYAARYVGGRHESVYCDCIPFGCIVVPYLSSF